MRPFIPRSYQRIIVEHIVNHPRCAIWASMGLGKTAAVLEALMVLPLFGYETGPTLIIAPLRVAKTTWPDEVQKWINFQGVTITPIIGSVAERKKALNTPSTVHTINYENTEWLVDYLGDKWPFETLVSDESTKLKGFRSRQGTKRAKALARVAHTKVKRFIQLTGTPAPNGLADLWGQLWFLDQGVRLGRTFTAFTQRWFQKSFDGFSITPLGHAQKEIEEKVKDICLSLDAKDYFDLQEPIRNEIYVELPPKARETYLDMEKRMYMELESDLGDKHNVEAFNAASRTLKCLQLANGASYVEESNEKWVEVHDAKIEALRSVVEEAAGMPVLVVYNFKSDLARLQAAFPRGRVLDKSTQTIRDWNAGKLPILFVHPASAGHGLSLQDGGNILAFFSVNWNLEEHLQVIERIGPTRQLQSGHNRPVFIHYILAKNTVDELVLERLRTKREVQDILLEAVKKRVDSVL